MLKRILWSSIFVFSMVNFVGCGGPPPEDPPEEISNEEMEENEEMGEVVDETP